MAIRSFGNRETEEFFVSGQTPRRAGWSSVAEVARRKLDMVHYAGRLNDLKAPPGNHLEALSGNWKGFHSIRINEQWRVVFHWTPAGPERVTIVDYH